MADALKKLRSQKASCKARLTRAANYLDALTDQYKLIDLVTRHEKISGIFTEFEDVQTDIELLEGLEFQEEERSNFEDQYLRTISGFQEIINPVAPPNNQGAKPQDIHLQTPNQASRAVRLPVINLPTFSGFYEDWLTFYDTFKSLIHSDNSIPDIQKFHYLKSSLSGNAASILNSLSISNENYPIAWDMLKSRYDNKRIIIHHHIKQIHELPVLHKENHATLRQIADGLSKHTRALDSLGRPVNHWDDLLIYIITKKLDTTTNKEWENTLSAPSAIPTLSEFTDFLNKKCQILETTSRQVHIPDTITHIKTTKTASHVSVSNDSCPVCKGKHFIYQCDQFKKLSAEQRISTCKRKNLCLNCLRLGHTVNKCTSGTCKTCKGKHNTLLHLENSQPSTSKETNTTVSNHASERQEQSHCLLSTALILIDDTKGKPHECRALLDCGSQSNFITKNLADRLGIKQETCSLPVVGINETATQINRTINVKIRSRLNAYQSNIKCLILNKITGNLPLVSIQKSAIDIPKNIRLADPGFNISGPIDLLIGIDLFWKLMCIGQIKSSEKQPCFQKTHFGWIIAGSVAHSNTRVSETYCNLVTNKSLDDKLMRFWQLEEYPQKYNFSPAEIECERHFTENFKRNAEGRFIVKLPFKNRTNQLGNSYQSALKRFYKLERQLDKNVQLKMQYSNFLKEYLELGHMKLVDVDPHNEDVSSSFYLPHHAVEKSDSTTTKLRVVFDGSCKSSNGISLNDTLMVGPTIQQDLFSIVTRFRTHKIALIADIAKMYRQVLVEDSDANYQRILWRTSHQDKIEVYNLCTVTYGTSAASFLAIKALQQLAQEEGEGFQVGAKLVMRDFYVDDLITGADSLKEALTIINETRGLLERGGFELRKWQSNSSEILNDTSIRISSEGLQTLDKLNSTKALGLTWNKNEDVFFYNMASNIPSKITKRSILAFISQLFDPLGLLGPLILIGKLIMQRLWQLKIDWDESTPAVINTQFAEYALQFRALAELKIPRKIIPNKRACVLELHGFSDASQDAYGACIYIRAIDPTGNISSNLVCAKSRVAPVKSMTIPRLELCGAVLLARLVDRVINTIDLEFREIRYWTDSTIVLAWIRARNKQWKTFVANRISEIHELTNSSQWNHVGSEHNPADIISRGRSLADIVSCDLWWQGPAFLTESSETISLSRLPHNVDETLPEEKPDPIGSYLTSNQTSSNFIFSKFSSFNKLITVTSYCFRFIGNTRNRLKSNTENNHIGSLTNQEREYARNQLIRIIQREQFANELHELTSSGTVGSKSKLLSLNPFLDKDGLIRVGGRLDRSRLPYDHRHPFVLPAKHELTALVIKHHHHQQLHAGVQGTIASIRSRYWPLSLKNSVKHVIRKCITCFKAKPRHETYIMGDLPHIRLGQVRPFLNSGVDLCGPFQVREHRRRNAKVYKIYVAIFICLSTRAIHIETLHDLTMECFLNTLKRFIGRRGLVGNLYSDNGTNFTGTNKEVKELMDQFKSQGGQDKLGSVMDEHELKWHFIPPRSPNFGGLWEAAVKSMKHHLRRVIGDTAVTVEQMQTLLIQIESVLNSRPLTPISNDPNDESFLTPAHFLIGDTFASLPEPDLLGVKVNRLSQWQHIERLKQHFWKRWHKEYLHQLQERTKWKKNQETKLQPGHLVIIKEDNVPPLRWITGRVEEIHPGHDGVIRAATVRVKGVLVKRPARKLCVLPLDYN